MRRSTLFLVVVGFLVAADAPQDEQMKLEGTYVLVSGEEKGEKVPEQTIKNSKLTFMGDKHTVKVGKETMIGTHKLDPAKKPAEIDVVDTEGPYKGKTLLGIYKLEGDQFTACFPAPGKDRPKEFTTKSGTGEILHTWKREKK